MPRSTRFGTVSQTEADAAKRNALLKEGQQYLSDQAVHGFLFQLPLLGVFRTEVKGYWSSRRCFTCRSKV